MKPITAYHFLAHGGRLRHPVNGHTYVVAGLALHEDEIQLCVRGLHASIKPIDALQYAPGPCLTLVECSGDVLCEEDKIVCTDRKVIAGPVDVTDIIVRFAQWCADRANATAAAAAAAAKVRPRQVRAPKSSTDERAAQNSWLRVEFARALKAGEP